MRRDTKPLVTFRAVTGTCLEGNHRLRFLTMRAVTCEGFVMPGAGCDHLEKPEKRLVDAQLLRLPLRVTHRAPDWVRVKMAQRGQVSNPPAEREQMEVRARGKFFKNFRPLQSG